MIGVAGEYTLSHGGALDAKATRRKTNDVDEDGIDLELHGGRYNDKKQKAVISLICDRQKTGNEGFDEEAMSMSIVRRDDDDDKDDGDNDDNNKGDRFKQDPDKALQFVSYGEIEDGKGHMDVLRLNWRTKYACEDFEGDGDDEPKKAGWGFFTWFILM